MPSDSVTFPHPRVVITMEATRGMALTDEQLLAQIALGDRAALGELFDRFHPRIFAFLCRMLGDRSLAEDSAQEVFWQVWHRAASFDSAKSCATWLFILARHTALNELKKPWRRGISGLGLKPFNCEVMSRAEADADADLALRDLVRSALQKLPEEQRLCIVLREFEELSFSEIGEMLGCSEGNARVIAHRAKNSLREILGPQLAENNENEVPA